MNSELPDDKMPPLMAAKLHGAIPHAPMNSEHPQHNQFERVIFTKDEMQELRAELEKAQETIKIQAQRPQMTNADLVKIYELEKQLAASEDSRKKLVEALRFAVYQRLLLGDKVIEHFSYEWQERFHKSLANAELNKHDEKTSHTIYEANNGED